PPASPGRRRAFRRVQRRALGARGVPRDPQPHPQGALTRGGAPRRWPGGRSRARRSPTRGPRRGRPASAIVGGMFVERARTSADAAQRDLAARRAALDDALAALDRGDPDADPIAVVDCALALQAAEAMVGAVRAA